MGNVRCMAAACMAVIRVCLAVALKARIADGGDDRRGNCLVEARQTYFPTARKAVLAVSAWSSSCVWVACSIAALLHPAGTVMDINIGAALWLAVRAQGRLLPSTPCTTDAAAGAHGADVQPPRSPAPDTARSTGGEQRTCSHSTAHARGGALSGDAVEGSSAPRQAGAAECAGSDGGGSVLSSVGRGDAVVVSQARAVLLGHGADEVFGGYGRHRTRFREGGWAGLQVRLPGCMHDRTHACHTRIRARSA